MIARADDLYAAPTTLFATDEEAFLELASMADHAQERLPADLLARHVLAVTAGGDWPVRNAALRAVLRRLDAVQRDELRVSTRPARGAVCGVYTTRRKRAPERPYATWIGGVEPLRASCDCRDFLRNALGLCKHVLAALCDAARKRRFESARGVAPLAFSASAHLAWDAVRPLAGTGDRIERLVLVSNGAAEPAISPEDAACPVRRLAAVRGIAREIESSQLDAEPAAAALLTSETARLSATHRQPLTNEDVETALGTLRRPLYAYQREGVARFLSAGSLLLADDMGLGKTAQAIAASHVLFATGRVRRGLLIVPASLKSQWLREWRQVSDAPIALVDGSAEQRAALYRDTQSGFLVANYEQVLRDLEAMHGWAPDLVVLDEAQRIKNWATKTAASVKRLRPTWRLVLTGTPFENRLDELASLMDWVDDHALEPRWRLGPWHTLVRDGRPGACGARNLDTLRARLAPSMLRRVRTEVLTQLPARTDVVIPVTLTEEQRDEHDALSQPIRRLLSQAQRRPLSQGEFLRLMSLLTTQRIVANGIGQLRFTDLWPALCERNAPDAALLDALGTPKLRDLREIVTQVAVGQGRRIVVFSQWRRMLRLAQWAVSDLLAAEGLRSVFFTGAESRERRTQNVIDFHDDSAVRVMFLTDAGGVGLNLQRAASCCVNLELPWNPAVLEQRIGRIHRLGQRDPIDVYNLVSQDSIEARIAMVVDGKRALFSGLFDGASDEVEFERSGSFLSRVERLVDPETSTDRGAASAVDRSEDAHLDESDVEPDDGAPLHSADVDDVDDAADLEIEALVAAGDEALDSTPADACSVPLPASPASPASPARPSSAHLGSAAALDPFAVGQLFAGMDVRVTPEGGLRIDAEPRAAATLAAVLEGLAALLRAVPTA